MEMKRKSSDARENPKYEKQEKRRKSGYMNDPKLIPRVQKYLQSQKNKKMVNISLMADEIQARYSEYGRKKKNAFRISVERAYEVICDEDRGERAGDTYSALERKYVDKKRRAVSSGSSDSESDSADSSGSFSDNNPQYTAYEDTNAMNSFMTNLYKKTPKSGPSSQSTPESAKHKSAVGKIKKEERGFRSCPSSPKRTDSSRSGSQSQPSSPRITIVDSEEEIFMIDRTGDTKLRNISASPKAKLKTASPKPKSRPTVSKATSEEVKKTLEKAMNKCDDKKYTPSKSEGSNIESTPREKSKEKIITEEQEVSPKLLDEQATESENKTSPPGGESGNKSSPPGGESGNKAPPPGSESGNKAPPPSAKKVKKKTASEKEGRKKGPEVQQSTVKFADVGGNEKTLMEVCKLLVHMRHPEVYTQLGVVPPRGFLLHGPPGCGKTLLAHAIAGELDLPFIKMAATEIVSGVSGESEEKVRDVFEKAMASAPCILFLDEIDAITQKRETASKDMERRIVSQLLTCMDDLNTKVNAHVLVIGATNRPDSLDPALRRAGRFDREISLGIPDEAARKRILEVVCRELRLSDDVTYTDLARQTPGYVGADLVALTREAAVIALNRVFSDLRKQQVNSGIKCNPSAELESGESMQVEGQSSFSSPVHTKSDPGEERTENAQSLNQTVISDNDNKKRTNSCDSTSESAVVSDSKAAGISIDKSCVEAENVIKDSEESGKMDVTPGRCEEHEEVITDHSEAVPMGSEVSERVKEQRSEVKLSLQEELNAVLSWLKDQPPLSEEQLSSLFITLQDFQMALKLVQPSAKREGFATIPDVKWEDIGALKAVREELQMAILAPVRHPEQFLALGLTSPPGILLAGPPGCGKTLLAKAVANESGINFISVKGPELLNMYVGESERAVRQVFQRARNSSPCVIFFDELDALCPRRSDSGEGGSSVRVVNQLLTEMDGLEERKQVFIMGATNRPDIIDPAILRPGRLDKTLYVGLPTAEDRLDILRTITKNGSKPRMSEDVDLNTVADSEQCFGFTGADIAALVREAAVTALREFMMSGQKAEDSVVVHAAHFNTAFSKVKPSVSVKDHKVYDKMKERLGIS